MCPPLGPPPPSCTPSSAPLPAPATHAAASPVGKSPATGKHRLDLDFDLVRWLEEYEAEQRAAGQYALSPEQRDAVALAASAPVLILTGAAGCGKTYVTRAMMALWKHPGKKVKLCAPTGG